MTEQFCPIEDGMRRRKPPGQRKAEEYANEYRRKPRHNSKYIGLRSRRRKTKQVFPSHPSAVESEDADAMTTEALPVHEHDGWLRPYKGVLLTEHLRLRHTRQVWERAYLVAKAYRLAA